MLNFFKRHATPPATSLQVQTNRPKNKPSTMPQPLEPLPTAQVVEGNEDSDWAMWEDSVSFLDSQMPTLETDSVRVRQTHTNGKPPEKTETPDPFVSVGRKST